MKFFKILAIAFVAFIALFFIVGLFLPKTGTVIKTYEINADAAAVEYEIFDLYQEHAWPIWNFEDTSVVFTDYDGGYTWEGDQVGKGECQYSMGADMTVRDHITILGREMAETVWTIKPGNPLELTVNFQIFAGGNIGARWTSLFLDKMVGDDIDQLIKSIKDNVEM
jgi:hypothetical protein